MWWWTSWSDQQCLTPFTKMSNLGDESVSRKPILIHITIGPQIFHTQHSTGRGWHTEPSPHLDMECSSRWIPQLYQQMHPNGPPPKCIPLINLTNTPEAWKGRLLQPLHLETCSLTQHNGKMDQENSHNKTPILHNGTWTDPPKSVQHHARKIDNRHSVMSSSQHLGCEQPQPLHKPCNFWHNRLLQQCQPQLIAINTEGQGDTIIYVQVGMVIHEQERD